MEFKQGINAPLNIQSLIRENMNVEVIFRAAIVLFAIFSSLYLKAFDIRGDRFLTDGSPLFLFNVLRAFWIILFLWFISGVGHFFTQKMAPLFLSKLSFLDIFITHFFVGGAIITVFTFVMGLLGILRYDLFFPIFIGTLICTPFPNTLLTREYKTWQTTRRMAYSKLERFTFYSLALALFYMTLIVILARVIWPLQAGNDVYEHYLPFQLQSVLNHSILPNDVWYQFFYSKGLSLNLISIMFIGILGPQTVSFCYVIVTCACIKSILTYLNINRALQFIGVLSIMSCFTYLGNRISHSFSTQHVQMIGWISGILWFAIQTGIHKQETYKEIVILSAITAAGTCVFFPLSASIILPFLFLTLIFARLFYNSQPMMKLLYWQLLFVTFVFMLILLTNYKISGLFSFDPINIGWRFANRDNLGLACDPNIIDFFSRRSDASSFTMNILTLLQRIPLEYIFRFDLVNWFYPFGITAGYIQIMIIISMMTWGGTNSISGRKAALLCGMNDLFFPVLSPVILLILTAILVAGIPGTPASISRNFIFMMVPLTILGIVSWYFLYKILSLINAKLSYFLFLISANIVIGAIVWPVLPHLRMIHEMPMRYFTFAAGSINIRTALAEGLTPQHDYGLKDIWVEAKSAIGVDTKVFALVAPTNSHASYLFPGNGVLTEPSQTGLNGKWHNIVYGSPDTAMLHFKEQGINFFIIRFAPDEKYLGGFVSLSELFDPNNMRKYFKVFWEKDGFYILTWRDNHSPALSASFLSQWAKLRSTSEYIKLYQELKTNYLKS